MKDNPEIAGRNQAGQFVKGQSGNPKGKPHGARSKATRAALALLHGQLEQLTQTAIDKALEGDPVALRLVLDKVLPTAKEAPIDVGAVALPDLSGENLPKAVGAVVEAVAGGALTPSQGQVLVSMLDGFRKSIELAELEKRIAALESGQGGER